MTCVKCNKCSRLLRYLSKILNNVYSLGISDLSNGVFTNKIGIPNEANTEGTHYLNIMPT